MKLAVQFQADPIDGLIAADILHESDLPPERRRTTRERNATRRHRDHSGLRSHAPTQRA